MKPNNIDKACNFVEKLWKNLPRVTEICAKYDNLREKHSRGGADMHYIDEKTPKGFMTVLKPDGKVTFKKLRNH
jgi:hypothetical protein